MHFLFNTFILLFSVVFLTSPILRADKLKIRWESNFALTDDLTTILRTINAENNLQLKLTDFVEIERRTLAGSKFSTYQQIYQGTPIQGTSLRAWSDLFDGHLIQMEAWLEEKTPTQRLKNTLFEKTNTVVPSETKLLETVLKKIKTMDDKKIISVKSRSLWLDSDLIREFTIVAKRGIYLVRISQNSRLIKSITYKTFPRFDIPAEVYPLWEETENLKPQKRIPVTLKNLLPTRKNMDKDPLSTLKSRSFLWSKHDELKARTQEGLAAGYWSLSWLQQLTNSLTTLAPDTGNGFSDGHSFFLVGKYATIQLDPSATTKFKNINFPLKISSRLQTNYFTIPSSNGTEENAIKLIDTYLGKPLENETSALSREAHRLPDHNVETYLNEGFDEVQVYYAIDKLMEVLHNNGFTDPELSTRAFNAFLYNLDIESKDNAFYFNDTINFTTYSPDQQNYTRDNTTIWHELGHGIMDRLMGDYLQLADSGGLSEGMADFIAKLIIQETTHGETFEGISDLRINNKTGFHLSNEEHDDGEAYGGAMSDILDLSIKKWGSDLGLRKMIDLTLDTMRLSRNHPGLTANDWFSHMLYADKLGKINTREKNEMSSLIINALNSRNFSFNSDKPARLIVFDGNHELDDESTGSRYNPNEHFLDKINKKEITYNLDISVQDGEFFHFNYPLKLEIQFNGGALQGAIKWKDENAGAKTFLITKAEEKISLPVTVLTEVCDFVNKEDGGCSDYAYIKIFEKDNIKPIGKKRFYIRLKNQK